MLQSIQSHVRSYIFPERRAIALGSAQRQHLRRVDLHDLILVRVLHDDLLHARAIGDEKREIVPDEPEDDVHRARIPEIMTMMIFEMVRSPRSERIVLVVPRSALSRAFADDRPCPRLVDDARAVFARRRVTTRRMNENE
jgi:hypothetical protein